MLICRILALTVRHDERLAITSYPQGCSEWATEACTRISIYKDECVGQGNLPSLYVNTFNSSQAAMLNSKLYECVEKSVTAKIIEPKGLWSSNEWHDFIHVSWSS